FGGYGAEIAAIIAEEAFDYLDGPVTRIAGPDVPGVPYNHVLEDWFMVNPEKILDGIRQNLLGVHHEPVLEDMVVRDTWHVRSGDASDRSVKVIERFLGDDRRDLRPVATE